MACLLLGLSPNCALTAERKITRGAYRGWADTLTVGNALAEVVIVPEIGRVMQFRFAGTDEGPFWENEKLWGRPMPPKPWETAHGSFGGDKTWPAPQSAWNWPPPDIFDAAPLAARILPDQSVVLTSEVSPRFGIRTQRRVVLEAGKPTLRIETTYEKVTGDPVEVAVWIITQTKVPDAVFLPVPAGTKFPAGSTAQWGIPTQHFALTNGLARFTRDPKEAHKIGNDAEQIVWVGPKEILRIDIARQADSHYPDDGCSVEVYSNQDPVPYVELETLGPLRRLAIGDRLSATNTYRLFRRQGVNALAEAERVLAP